MVRRLFVVRLAAFLAVRRLAGDRLAVFLAVRRLFVVRLAAFFVVRRLAVRRLGEVLLVELEREVLLLAGINLPPTEGDGLPRRDRPGSERPLTAQCTSLRSRFADHVGRPSMSDCI